MNRILESISTVLFDIDGTLTDVNAGFTQDEFRRQVFAMLAKYVSARHNISAENAAQKLDVFTCRELIWWDYCDIIVHFDLDAFSIWQEMRSLHRQMLKVYHDGATAVKYLVQSGKNVHIISNNPVTGCLLKLEFAGLATLNGNHNFGRIFGTNITRGMKSAPATWLRTLAALAVNGDEVLTVGDSVPEDCDAAQLAGITHTVIVKRDAETPIVSLDKYCQVKSLDLIAQGEWR